MGYTIKIGELTSYIEIDEDNERYEWDDVIEEKHGPVDDSPTSGKNSRWPSYSGWTEFMDDIKIPKKYTIDKHPGYVEINSTLIDMIDKVDIEKLYAYNQERFIWFSYWCHWAFNNCKTPVIYNR